MIPLDTLKAVKTVVSHQNCADGAASALILKDVLPPETEFLFMQYKTPELAALEAAPHMLFVDFSPPAERFREFLRMGAVVLDHHKTAKLIVQAFGDLGVYADEKEEPGVSGAVLAMREVWVPLHRAEEELAVESGRVDPTNRPDHLFYPNLPFWTKLAQLAGVYDTWQTKHPWWQAARAQAEALRWWPWAWLKDASVDRIDDMLDVGEPLLEKQSSDVDKALKRAYRFATTKGTRVTVFQGTDIINDAAEAAGDAADLVMGFRYEYDGASGKGKLIFSCRTRGGRYEVSALAQHYGGGGHSGAAGFSVPFSPISPQPFVTAQLLVNAYESGETLIPELI